MRRSSPAVLAAVLFLCACGRSDVASYRVPKGSADEASPEQAHPAMPGLPAAGARAQEAPAASLRWSMPKGWKEKAPSSMRVASFDAPAGGGVCDVSIVVLEGDAMGPLANVNRWRGQVGLPPLSGEKALAENSRKVKTGAGEALVVDLEGKDARLIAAVLSRKGETWFVKLTGPDKAAAAAKPAFLALVESLKP